MNQKEIGKFKTRFKIEQQRLVYSQQINDLLGFRNIHDDRAEVRALVGTIAVWLFLGAAAGAPEPLSDLLIHQKRALVI